jgi:hypothetical protein
LFTFASTTPVTSVTLTTLGQVGPLTFEAICFTGSGAVASELTYSGPAATFQGFNGVDGAALAPLSVVLPAETDEPLLDAQSSSSSAVQSYGQFNVVSSSGDLEISGYSTATSGGSPSCSLSASVIPLN